MSFQLSLANSIPESFAPFDRIFNVKNNLVEIVSLSKSFCSERGDMGLHRQLRAKLIILLAEL
jgi:hypothetical protein